MFNNNLNNGSWSSLYFTRSIQTPKKGEVNIDLLASLPEKLKAISNEKIKDKKKPLPGETLLKKLHKQQKKKPITSDDDDTEYNIDKYNIDKYTNSINHVMQTLEI